MFYYYRNRHQWISAAEAEGYVIVIFDEHLFAHDFNRREVIRGHYNVKDNCGYVENDLVS